MEKTYWIARKRAAKAMARGAASSEARLIHYEMAGRYSIKAAHAFPPPSPQVEKQGLRLEAPEPPERRESDGRGR